MEADQIDNRPISPIQPYKIPEEAELIRIKWGDGKHSEKTNKPNRVMEHTLIKNQCSPMNSTEQPFRIIIGS